MHPILFTHFSFIVQPADYKEIYEGRIEPPANWKEVKYDDEKGWPQGLPARWKVYSIRGTAKKKVFENLFVIFLDNQYLFVCLVLFIYFL